MVVLFFTLSKQKLTYSTREFADYLKSKVLSGIDQKKVVPLELGIMKDLVTDNLDSLLKINDELIKNDLEIGSFLKNLEKKIYELDSKQELSVNIKGTIVKIEEGISQFSWDESRYPKNQKTIPDILNKINEKFNATFQNLKAKTEEYQNEVKKLQLKKKGESDALSLMKVDYREIVSKSEDKMITTDYLCTILCFVPISLIDNFLKNYMNYGDGYVLPLSALRIDLKEDEKMSLFRVVVMKHIKDKFKQNLQSNLRIQSRDYDPEEIKRKPQEEREIEKLSLSIKEKKITLIRNSTSGYSEVYYGLLHLKFLRLYVESSLKYGTSDYYSCIVFTSQGKEQKCVSTMIKTFNDTNDEGWYGTKEELKESEDFYPFILIKLGVPTNI